jgi:hypothetical protein
MMIDDASVVRSIVSDQEVFAQLGTGENGRSGRIRTCDPRVPNAVLYQTEPHSDLGGAI